MARKKKARESAPPPAAPIESPPVPSVAERWAWTLAAVPLFWSFAYEITRGSDLWWHLAGGRWTVEHGAIARADPFAFTTAGRTWLNDAWLSDVVFDLWTTAWGVHSLAWWKWALVVGTFLWLLVTLARVHRGSGTESGLACLIALAASAPFLDMRPQLYSCLGMVAVLALGLGRPRVRWLLPVVFLVWVNLHAGVLLGVLVLPLVLAPELLGRDRAARRQAAGIAALSAAACLLNPNGIAVFTRPLRYALDPTSPFRTLGEWLPPFRPGGIQSPVFPYLIGTFAVGVLVLVVGPWRVGGWRVLRRTPAAVWIGMALGALTLAMALRSRRFVPFFAILSTMTIAPALQLLLAPVRARVPVPVFRLIAPAIACLVGLLWLAPYPRASYAFHYMTAEDTFPIDTCDFIETNALEGDVFAYYNWGGYLHHRTAGRFRVFIDGRAGAVFDDDTYRRYVGVLSLQPGWLDVIESTGARYVLWPRHHRRIVAALVASGRWRRLHEDAVAVLFIRRDVEPDASLRLPPPSPYRDLATGLHLIERNRFAEAIPPLQRARAGAPYMKLACELLAKAQAGTGDVQAGRRTIGECQQLFPHPYQVPQFEAFVRWLAQR